MEEWKGRIKTGVRQVLEEQILIFVMAILVFNALGTKE